MGKALKRIVLCHTDDFPQTKNDKIKGWVEHNGGKFLNEITPEVTHLVASDKAWKRYIPIVKEARRLKSIKIVTLEWLEDSLLLTSPRPLPTSKYEFERKSKCISKRRNKTSHTNTSKNRVKDTDNIKSTKSKDELIEETGVKFDRSCQQFEKNMADVGYHPYIDENNFTYLLNLVRTDILRNRIEKHQIKVCHPPSSDFPCPTNLHYFPKPYPFSSRPVAAYDTSQTNRVRVRILKPWAQCLQLYESNSEPHTYACYTQYTNPKPIPITTLAPIDSTWDFAWDSFQKFFKKKCGYNWGSKPNRINEKIKDREENFFEYREYNSD